MINIDDIKGRVLGSAKELFIKQGYKKTTIRQIAEKSGVLIGSIYYCFQNKEDIFKMLALYEFELANKYTTEKLVNYGSEVYRYTLSSIVELIASENNERIRELHYEAYSSNVILDSLVRHTAMQAQEVFKPYNPDFSYEDYYRQTLATKGVIRNFCACNYMGVNIPLEEKINSFLSINLNAFNVPSYEIEEVRKRLTENKDEIESIVSNYFIRELLSGE